MPSVEKDQKDQAYVSKGMTIRLSHFPEREKTDANGNKYTSDSYSVAIAGLKTPQEVSEGKRPVKGGKLMPRTVGYGVSTVIGASTTRPKTIIEDGRVLPDFNTSVPNSKENQINQLLVSVLEAGNTLRDVVSKKPSPTERVWGISMNDSWQATLFANKVEEKGKTYTDKETGEIKPVYNINYNLRISRTGESPITHQKVADEIKVAFKKDTLDNFGQLVASKLTEANNFGISKIDDVEGSLERFYQSAVKFGAVYDGSPREEAKEAAKENREAGNYGLNPQLQKDTHLLDGMKKLFAMSQTMGLVTDNFDKQDPSILTSSNAVLKTRKVYDFHPELEGGKEGDKPIYIGDMYYGADSAGDPKKDKKTLEKQAYFVQSDRIANLSERQKQLVEDVKEKLVAGRVELNGVLSKMQKGEYILTGAAKEKYVDAKKHISQAFGRE